MSRKEFIKKSEIVQSLGDNMPGIFFQVEFRKTNDFQLIYVCERIETLTGYTSDEILQNQIRLSEFVNVSERKNITDAFKKAVKEIQIVSFATKIETREGERWYKVQIMPCFSEGGRCFLNGVALDITDEKQKEKELHETANLLRKTLDSIEEAVFIIGAGHRQIVQACNASVETIFGYKKEELENDTTKKLHLNQEFFKKFGEISEPELDNLGRFEKEYQMRRKDGKIIDTHNTVTVLDKNKGWQGGVVSTVKDITRRKEREKTLLENKKKFRELVEEINDVIFRTDENGHFTYVSPVIRTFGLDPAEMVGRPFKQFVHPNDVDEIANQFSKLMSGAIIPFEYRILTKSGKSVWIRTSSKPLFEAGIFKGIQGVATDISEERSLRNQLYQSQKLESIGQLAGGVAHDFNNMLSIIINYGQELQGELNQSDPLQEAADEIVKAGRRSAELTRQLLAFSRRQTLQPVVLNLNAVIKNLEKMLRRLIGEDIVLKTFYDEELEKVRVDPGQIEQVVINIAVNAREAMPRGGKLTIETRNTEFDEALVLAHTGNITPGKYVMLSISDNGCGMDQETRKRIFEPFFTTREKGKGTGLGLSTVYGIVKQSSGNIWVYSEPGKGTTFKIYLPQLVADENIYKAVPKKKATAGGAETILLVEDEPSILKMTRRMLEKTGYNVLSAATPSEAMEKAKDHSGAIDMLMTDVVMPEMNGRELAGQIRVLFPGIRLLFMSGYTASVIAHKGILDDGVTFIQKPFSMADLTEKVRDVLDSSSDND